MDQNSKCRKELFKEISSLFPLSHTVLLSQTSNLLGGCVCVFMCPLSEIFKHIKRLNILYSFFSPFVHKWWRAIHTVFHLDFYLIFILENFPYQFIEFLFFFNIWMVLHYVDVIIYLAKALLMDTGLFPVVSYPKQYCFEKPSSLCISLMSKHILRGHKQVPGFWRYTAGVWSLAPPDFKPQQLCVLESVT